MDGDSSDSNDASDDGLHKQTFHVKLESDRGLQAVALNNMASANSASSPTILHYTQGPDGQYFIPVQHLNSSGLVSFSPRSIMVNGGGDGHHGEDLSRKRELRLLKNKEAAKECRRKKKEYVKCLENRVAVLENQNKTLIEELKSLKELYCQKDAHS